MPRCDNLVLGKTGTLVASAIPSSNLGLGVFYSDLDEVP